MKNMKLLLFMCCMTLGVVTLQGAGSCTTEEDCINNDKCQCYCSVKCGFRDKDMKQDRPVFVENDPNGIHCYCKEWDLKNYKKRHCDRKKVSK